MRQLRDEPDELRERMIARAKEVAEDLLGTAKNLDDHSTEEERDNRDFCEALDAEVLECDTCGWWTETAEMCRNNNCGDCCNDVCEHDGDEEEE